MRISGIDVSHRDGGVELTARFEWESAGRDPFEFVLFAPGTTSIAADQAGNALLAASLPIAFHDRETRLRIEAPVCPMLADGLATALECWNAWDAGAPLSIAIETDPSLPCPQVASTQAVMLLSGGVDSMHLLQRNANLYRPTEPAAISRAIFIHGFDIGKRRGNAELGTFEQTRARLAKVCEAVGVSLSTCSTNLRQIKTKSGFWTGRFYGPAALAMAHALVPGRCYLKIAGTYDIANLAPIGSSPLVDVLFSSQRLQVLHEDLRFSRLAKLRNLIAWPLGIDNLRVCAMPGRTTYNCRTCEKCVRTRLGLLAAGCLQSDALGNHCVTLAELSAVELSNGYQIASYREIAVALAAGPHASLAEAIADKLHTAPTAQDGDLNT